MKVLLAGCDDKTTAQIHASMPNIQPDVLLLETESLAQSPALAQLELPDLVILHSQRNNRSLLQSVADIRSVTVAPIMVLGEGPDQMEIVGALSEGADEYVRIPCSVAEMVARIWALLRLSGLLPFQGGDLPYHCGDLIIYPATLQAFVKDRSVKLSPTEFRFLEVLARNSGNIVQPARLGQELPDRPQGQSTLVKKYIQRLRSKLEDQPDQPEWIETVRGVGYRFLGPKPSLHA